MILDDEDIPRFLRNIPDSCRDYEELRQTMLDVRFTGYDKSHDVTRLQLMRMINSKLDL